MIFLMEILFIYRLETKEKLRVKCRLKIVLKCRKCCDSHDILFLSKPLFRSSSFSTFHVRVRLDGLFCELYISILLKSRR